jgi:hypothetical protein
MFIEYVAFIDEECGPGHYVTKTRVMQVIPDDKTRLALETYTEQAHKFGMVPCLVVPDIFRDPKCDVLVYCRLLHAVNTDEVTPVSKVIMGFKQEFYINHMDMMELFRQRVTKCPAIWLWNVITWHLRVPDIMNRHLSINWMTEPVRVWLDTLIRDLSVMHIPINGYRALDIPGKVRLSVSGVSADTACHHLALVRYILLRKQTVGIRVNLCESLDPRDRSQDRTAGCTVSVAIDTETVANRLDTTICDCPDRFDSVFGVNRCETLVIGGPWWSYNVGLNTLGKSVNVKTNRVTGEVNYMVDIRPGSQVNPYKYAAWLLPQLPKQEMTCAVPDIDSNGGRVGLALAMEGPVIPYKINTQETELDKDESEDELDNAEIDGLTIISHHESEPEHRLAALARIKRRHKSNTTLSRWVPKLW